MVIMHRKAAIILQNHQDINDNYQAKFNMTL